MAFMNKLGLDFRYENFTFEKKIIEPRKLFMNPNILNWKKLYFWQLFRIQHKTSQKLIHNKSK